MVSEVLDFSRLRTGSLELAMTRFNLTELVRKIVDRISHMTAVEGYTVTFEAAEDVFVTADSGRISQVIYNLAGNALTYTGADKAVRIRQERKDGMVRITITDSGEGIPPEELPKIWNRFYQVDKSRQHSQNAGLGLGLAMVREIARLHGGSVDVSSEPDRGSVFTVRFENPRL